MKLYIDTTNGTYWTRLDLALEDEHGETRAALAPLQGEGALRTIPFSHFSSARYRLVEDSGSDWKMVPCVLRIVGHQVQVLERSGLLQEFLDKSGLRYALFQMWESARSLVQAVRSADAERLG